MLSAYLGEEDGAVGGLEALPFGVLIFVVGTLLIANAWSVIDTKLAVTSAAREGARAFAEAGRGGEAEIAATARAREAVGAHRRGTGAVDVYVAGSFARCARVRVTVSTTVPALRVPWIGGLLPTRVASTAAELVDPLRSDVNREATCLAR